jgi:nucleoside-diphosphate-sugar epimerase
MKVLVAGATGVIGRSLVPALLSAGHEVYGTTRTAAKLDTLVGWGVHPELCDAFDAAAVHALVQRIEPDAIVNQLTDLPDAFSRRAVSTAYGRTGRIRREGTRHLLDAAAAAGVPRFVTQSIAFLYAPGGSRIKSEDDAPATGAPGPFGEAVRGTVDMEQMVLAKPGIAGVVLRYGAFYGPGTWYARDGSLTRMVRRRMHPIVGDGGGMFSWLHVDDAASATVRAVESGVTGVFNITDDEPAPVSEWLPVFAAAMGAPRPMHAPAWLVRLVAGESALAALTVAPGASNARARTALGWAPRWSSWREGFVQAPS